MDKKSAFLRTLLRPYWKSLLLAFAAALGETAAGLAEPWPIKLVLDNVLRGKSAQSQFLARLATFFGAEKHTFLIVAVGATLTIAIAGALFSYAEKLLTTTVGQRVMHDLRSTLYSRMQRLSLSYHDQARTGDLIGRVTSDVDSIQSFVTSGLLSAFINGLTLLGMVGVMFWIDWRFTLIALSVVPLLFAIVFRYTRKIKRASREVRKKEGQIVSLIQEVLSSIRVVKAFAQEDREIERFSTANELVVTSNNRVNSLWTFFWPLIALSWNAKCSCTKAWDRYGDALSIRW